METTQLIGAVLKVIYHYCALFDSFVYFMCRRFPKFAVSNVQALKTVQSIHCI